MTKLKRYQRKGVYLIKKFGGRAILADEMGLGKSIQSLTFVERENLYPCIIVCPAALKWNWEREVAMHIGREVTILEGRKPPRRKRIRHTSIIIVNYDIVGDWLPYLLSVNPESLIIDEAQYISNRKTKRAKAVKRLGAKVEKIIALSGTPLTNRPREIYPIVNLLRPDLFPSFRPFANRYCGPKLTPWGWKFDGATHLDELHEILKERLMIRRRKVDVLKDLPPKTRHIIPVDIEKRDEYKRAQSDYVSWLRDHLGEAVRDRVIQAQRVVRRMHLWRLVAEMKLPSVISWIDSFLANTEREKLVVFGIHYKILIPLYERYRKHGAVLINGKIRGKDRQQAIDLFQKDRGTRLLFGNYRAAGVGSNYTSASTGISVELPWTPAEALQGEDRLARMGQKFPVDFYYLVAKGTVEEMHCDLLQRKQGIIVDRVLDGKKNLSDFSLFDELEKELLEHEPS